ncbi:MAG: hypothetical protein CMJ31_10985 [Phycisphaerae bacterium]|nr:hypothetical protein [Phycisphaerae bacterium]
MSKKLEYVTLADGWVADKWRATGSVVLLSETQAKYENVVRNTPEAIEGHATARAASKAIAEADRKAKAEADAKAKAEAAERTKATAEVKAKAEQEALAKQREAAKALEKAQAKADAEVNPEAVNGAPDGEATANVTKGTTGKK